MSRDDDRRRPRVSRPPCGRRRTSRRGHDPRAPDPSRTTRRRCSRCSKGSRSSRACSGSSRPERISAWRRGPRATSTTPTATASSPSGGDGGRSSRHGMYVRDGADSAEVAFAVADALRGEGIATTMLAHLARGGARGRHPAASSRDVLPRRTTGCSRSSATSGLRGDRALRARRAARSRCRPSSARARSERYDEREASAAAAAVRRVLRPRSVAVVGASAAPGSVGGAILRNLIAAGFTGAMHVGQPTRRRGRGLRRAGDRSPTSRASSTWRSSPRPRSRCSALRATARPRASTRSSSSRPASPRRGPKAPRAQHELLRDLPRRAACASSAPTASACSTPTRPCASTRASRPAPPAGRVGVHVAERRARHRRRRGGARGGRRALVVRLGGQQGRPVGQRLPRLLGAGRGDRRDPAVPRVVREPAQFARVARAVAARKPIVAVKGGRSAAGRARGRLAHRRAAGRAPTRPSTRCSRRPA